MERLSLGKRVGTNAYTTGILARALASQIYSEKGFEVTPEQYLILNLLVENGELYQRQISEITLKDRANVSRFVNILKEKELIEKIPEARGRRIYKIIVTPKGKELRDKIHPTAMELRKILSVGIDPKEMKITIATLKKIYQNAIEKVKLRI